MKSVRYDSIRINPILEKVRLGSTVVFRNKGRSKVDGINWQTPVYAQIWLDGQEKPVGFYVDGTHYSSRLSVFDIVEVKP